MERLKIKSLRKKDRRLIGEINDRMIGVQEIMKNLLDESGKANRQLFQVLRECFKEQLRGKKIIRFDVLKNELIICDEIEEETKGDE